MNWLSALPDRRRRGSFPRCLLFMEGDRTLVAAKLSELVGLPEVGIEATDYWMPRGLPVPRFDGGWDLSSVEEAKLGESKRFLADDQRTQITTWWLAVQNRANTPNWDIASTCAIGEKRGLLLVEAKAHEAELKEDGKALARDASEGSIANHEQIQRALATASAALNEATKSWNQRWNLSSLSHYQLANRFAWAWKLASIGVPVVLVYLGFLGAMEVSDLGKPFVDQAEWSRVVMQHCQNTVPEQAWGSDIRIGCSTIKPLIRVWNQPRQCIEKEPGSQGTMKSFWQLWNERR